MRRGVEYSPLLLENFLAHFRMLYQSAFHKLPATAFRTLYQLILFIIIISIKVPSLILLLIVIILCLIILFKHHPVQLRVLLLMDRRIKILVRDLHPLFLYSRRRRLITIICGLRFPKKRLWESIFLRLRSRELSCLDEFSTILPKTPSRYQPLDLPPILVLFPPFSRRLSHTPTDVWLGVDIIALRVIIVTLRKHVAAGFWSSLAFIDLLGNRCCCSWLRVTYLYIEVLIQSVRRTVHTNPLIVVLHSYSKWFS